MDALEKRIRGRMKTEEKDLRGQQMRLGKRRQTIGKQITKALDAQKTYLLALIDGKAVTAKAAVKAVAAADKELPRLRRELIRVNAQMDKIAEALATLESPQEASRRVERVKQLGASEDEGLSGPDAAALVLIQHGKPMHYTEITDRVLETGVVKLSGKTPAQTMSAYLAKEAVKPDGRFVRVDHGIFDVRKAEKVEKAS